MVRVKLGNGQWQDLDDVAKKPERFQRADGSRMTDDEISAIAGAPDVKFNKSLTNGRRKHSVDEYWSTVKRLGTQADAAVELGVSQGAVQSGLKAYMKAHGIEGPLPGKMTTEQLRERRQRALAQKPINGAAHYEPLEEAAYRDAIADDDANAPVVDVPDPLGVAMERIFDRVESVQLDKPPITESTTVPLSEQIADDDEPEWTPGPDLELSRDQGILVLRAVLPEVVAMLADHPTQSGRYSYRGAAHRIIEVLSEYGFDLTIVARNHTS